MFGRRKLTNVAAAGALPRPPIAPPIIHNHNQTPWPGIILALFGCFILTLPLLWWILVFLADRMGFRNPEMAVAEFLVILPLSGGGLWFTAWIIGSIIGQFHDHDREMMVLKIEMERVRLLTAQSDVDGMRMNSEDRNFAKLIIIVMYEAIANGPRGKNGEIRWSRRQAKALADLHGLSLSETKCGTLAGWLRQYGVITQADKITPRYQSLGEVKRLVADKFNVPVTIGDDIGMSSQHLRGMDGDSMS